MRPRPHASVYEWQDGAWHVEPPRTWRARAAALALVFLVTAVLFAALIAGAVLAALVLPAALTVALIARRRTWTPRKTHVARRSTR